LKGRNVDEFLPQTYLVRLDKNYFKDEQFRNFKMNFKSDGELWIYKPGEASNRGNGIKVLKDLKKIEEHINSEIQNS